MGSAKMGLNRAQKLPRSSAKFPSVELLHLMLLAQLKLDFNNLPR